MGKNLPTIRQYQILLTLIFTLQNRTIAGKEVL
ncbi:MAG: hypothetical protein ACI9IP_003379, partial [Arcticibacterium sp.]